MLNTHETSGGIIDSYVQFTVENKDYLGSGGINRSTVKESQDTDDKVLPAPKFDNLLMIKTVSETYDPARITENFPEQFFADAKLENKEGN